MNMFTITTITLFQAVALTCLAAFTILQVVRLHKEPLVRIVYKMSWIAPIFAGMMVIAFPGISVFLSNLFGIKRGVDFIIYTSIIWLLYKNYTLSKEVENTENKIEKLVREGALKDNEKTAKHR
jgi:hypothetical protein